MLTDDQIARAFKWSATTEVATKRGPRHLRKASATPESMDFWKANEWELAAAGVTYGLKWKSQTDFEFCWWKRLPSDVINSRETNQAMSRATSADIDVPCPPGQAYLPYQKAGIAFGIGKKAVLIGDDMGLGKTIQAIGIINACPEVARVLVVCPSKLKINWYRELRTWLTKKLTIGIVEADCFPTSDIAIINYDIVHKFPTRLSFNWDMLILDEAHKIKNPKARRTRAIIGYKPKRDEPAEMAKSGIPCKRKVALTGTPIMNRREEIWPLVHYLAPETFDNWYRFNHKMTLDQVQQALRQSIMIRRLKKDVLTELPPKRRQIIPLPPDLNAKAVIARERSAMAKWEGEITKLEAAVELAKAEDSDRYAAAVRALHVGVKASFADGSKVRKETAMAKLPLAKAYIEETLDEVDKLVILAYHRDVIDELYRAFQGVGALRIYGGISTTESQRNVDLFQNDPNYKVIILQIHVAIGMTLTAASTVIAVELDWVPAIMSQAEDRCHRIGQRDSVNVYHLVLDGSMDHAMAVAMVEKQAICDAALDKTSADLEANTPVTPFRRKPSPTAEKIAREAETITTVEAQVIHANLRKIAGRCDGAHQRDGQGFSKLDANIGQQLAFQSFLTPKQAVIGKRLVNRYKGQIA